jgi:uncharacterized protein
MAKPAQKRELDYDLIFDAVTSNDIWALDWKYRGLQLDVPTPPEVKTVCDILDMWERIERDFADLSSEEKARVQTESYRTDLKFMGFDGNNETELMHIAGLLINKLER